MIRFSYDTVAAGTGERILVIGKKYIGDTVLAIPFLRNLRQAFPAAVIDVFAEGAARDVLVDCPHVDEVVEWIRPARPRGLGMRAGRFVASFANIESTAARLRQRGYSRAYLLKNSLSAAVLAARAAIPHRVGFVADLGSPLLSRAVRVRPGRHQVELYLDLLRADGLAVDDGHNENWVSPDAAARVAALLAGLPTGRPRVFVACCATKQTRRWPHVLAGRRPDRAWPLGHWAELIAWLVESRGCEVVFCGSLVDMPTHALIRDSVGPRLARHVHDFSDRGQSLRDMAAILARMDLCLGIDTGPMHVAASFGLPVISLFGPSDPNRWAPWTARRAVVRPPAAAGVALPASRAAQADRSIHSPPQPWGPGPDTLQALPVAAVREHVAAFLAERGAAPQFKSVDLRAGSFRYEVVDRPSASVRGSAPTGEAAAAATGG